MGDPQGTPTQGDRVKVSSYQTKEETPDLHAGFFVLVDDYACFNYDTLFYTPHSLVPREDLRVFPATCLQR